MVSLYQLAITLGILAAYFANAQILSLGEAMVLKEGGFWQWVMSIATLTLEEIERYWLSRGRGDAPRTPAPTR